MKAKRLSINSSASEILARVNEATSKNNRIEQEEDVLELFQEVNIEDILTLDKLSNVDSNTIPSKTSYNKHVLTNKEFTYENNRGNVANRNNNKNVDKLQSVNKLVSETTAETISEILSQLKQNVSNKNEHFKINSQVTIEEIVSELLKPQLKDWLDKNLPEIVKTIVEKEVKKLMASED